MCVLSETFMFEFYPEDLEDEMEVLFNQESALDDFVEVSEEEENEVPKKKGSPRAG